MPATGLAANPKEYRERLNEQTDEQIDAWAAELMRDVAIRRGVLTVIRDFIATAGIDERGFERMFEQVFRYQCVKGFIPERYIRMIQVLKSQHG